MIIANPIYDTVFKFLLEDLTIAKKLISVIIGEEVLELEVRPQEQTTPSNKFLLTVFRLDFKAIIKTANGEQKKVLIELQKSNHAYDVMRFRHYLGSNYSVSDVVNGEEVVLPILPIYFLGFPLSIKHAVLKIGRQYQDISSGEILDEKDSFIEKLTHDAYVVQITRLTSEMQTKIDRILSIFNQKFLFNEENKWLLSYQENVEDEDLKLFLKRLSLAAETTEVQQQIRVEEIFDKSMDSLLREKEAVIEQKEAVIEQKEAVIEQKEAVIEQKEAVIEQKDLELEALRKKIQELENKK